MGITFGEFLSLELMKTFPFLLAILPLTLVGVADETDLATFRKEMLANVQFHRVLKREFNDWDENQDGRLDREDGVLEPDGLFLSVDIFNRIDTSKSKSVSVIEYIDYQIEESFYALDTNRNNTLSANEKKRVKKVKDFFKWLDKGNLEFEIEGEIAYCNGTIKGKVVKQFRELFTKHPGIKTLVFGWMPGSVDDERLFEALEIIREKGVTTHAADHARIYSGAVDLFTVGKKRTMGKDVEFGVHTWASGRRREGRKLPKDHKQHRPYLDYYNSVGVPVDFYWFTLEAADAEGMHLMTLEELKKYKIVSE